MAPKNKKVVENEENMIKECKNQSEGIPKGQIWSNLSNDINKVVLNLNYILGKNHSSS